MGMKEPKVIAYDLGTGGIKASLFSVSGNILSSVFIPYSTCFPQKDWQEQAPEDWWEAVVCSTRQLLKQSSIPPEEIVSLAISGHSLGVVPIGKDGRLLRKTTPIWSDQRATQEAEDFFTRIDYQTWYEHTGNGFPPACYSVFKIMWYRNHEPEMFAKIHQVIGTKDYCNYRFTGRLCTDASYASGSGVFNLHTWRYEADYIQAAGLDASLFPEILSSDAVIGTLTEEAARETGLNPATKVMAGGVDNSCMALGAGGIRAGEVYTSLGSSAWIALIDDKPILDFQRKPYVFAHLIPGLYTSATCIFSAGNSYRWVRDTLCMDLLQHEKETGVNAYVQMDKLAATSVPGSNGVCFNPSLAGGSMLEPSPFICGAFAGLEKIVSRRGKDTSIGFGAKVASKEERGIGEIIKDVQPEDLIKYGLIPEFVGRMPVIATLSDLSEDALVKVLTEPKNALLKQYQTLFDMEDVKLTVTDEALKAIAKKAIERKTGARGLRAILEENLLELMYEIPDKKDVAEIIIDEKVINDKKQPKFILRKESSKKSA